MSICILCGEKVQPSDDFSRFSQYIRIEGSIASISIYCADHQHIFPSPFCAGNPDIAQYLEGQPRDPYSDYFPTMESIIRNAFSRFQVEIQILQLVGQIIEQVSAGIIRLSGSVVKDGVLFVPYRRGGGYYFLDPESPILLTDAFQKPVHFFKGPVSDLEELEKHLKSWHADS